MKNGESQKYRNRPYMERFDGTRLCPENKSAPYYIFYFEDGRSKRLSLKTRNRRVAEREYQKKVEQLEAGIHGFPLRPKIISFEKYAEHYLEVAKLELAHTSWLRHRQNLFGLAKKGKRRGHLLRFFGHRNLRGIRIKDILEYIRRRQLKEAAPNTVHRELATLSAIFRLAMQEEMVIANPVLSVKKPKLKLTRPNYTPNESELRSLFACLYPGARRFFLAFLNSGCRKAELVNCTVRDADLETGLLHVVGKGDRERYVPMNPVLEQCIREELMSRPDAKPGDPLFLNKDGRPYRSMREALSTACRKAGIPHITHHSLRHAYATLARRKGMKVEDLSKILGHANPTVTQNIYIKVFDPELRDAAENFSIAPEHKRRKKGANDQKPRLGTKKAEKKKAANN